MSYTINAGTPFALCIKESDVEKELSEYQEEVDRMIAQGASLEDVIKFLWSEHDDLEKSISVPLPKEVTLDDYWYETCADFQMVRGVKWEDLMADMKASPDFKYKHSPLSYSEYYLDLKSGDVYRYSDHWGKVASCRWYILPDNAYQHNLFRLGVCNIKDFSRFANGKPMEDCNNPDVYYMAAAGMLAGKYVNEKRNNR